ncbi:MAG: flagellar hook protein FlgE [Gammaproteobacteria bacterium]|nr:flagellar hook protein FlgE [Gammaproteobacteria bacterium]MBU1443358.1 flagellar hook protein FlgE [Gammaproteobacteria bacterium]MBU2286153.1 flagellar hook protein FlgE [Gammaproteobacteria bacterium]MBU2409415.1 flagellar hook protein FlgE [Gammaproteobacteria bacterium]
MSFQQGLSGLNAASQSLNAIGHNIANANTVGMKSSRAEFAEIYASAAGGIGGTNVGLGVEVGTVSQQFSQGTLTITGNDLDVAINGGGFFQVKTNDGSTAYTRAGNFKLDKEGNIVTNAGAQVMGYATDSKGVRQSFDTQPLKLPTGSPIPAKQTTKMAAEITLDASAVVASTATPPTPLSAYGTSLTAFDPQGLEIPVGLYFEKAANNSWNVFTSVNGSDPATSTPFTLNFNADGSVDTASSTVPPLTLASPNDPAQTFTVNLDLSKMTQVNSRFTVSDLTQDGYASGQLTGIRIEDSGIITASYSNGQTQAAGQVALVNFRNAQGLAPTGAGYWVETAASGQPVRGAPGEGTFGQLRSGALEESNVDLTAELVNMMTTQRAYQANAQTIKTEDQIMSTLVNLR